MQDGDESAVDCGGSCPGCGLAGDCYCDSDCASNNCSNAHCAPVVEIGEAEARFAYIPAGTFCMGSPGGGGTEECPDDGPAELGRGGDEGPLHEVTLTRGFYLQSTEVTQGQWEAAGFANPSSFDTCGFDCPVETVNWWETAAYLNALSEAEGLDPCYELTGCTGTAGINLECTDVTISDPNATGIPYQCEGYRLPTEAEWEYAYRAGTTTTFYNGDITYLDRTPLDPNLDAIAWYGGNSGVEYEPGWECDELETGALRCGTHVVGMKAPNAWGLHDMPGNVWEWVWDWWTGYPTSNVVDPLGGAGSGRTHRGGSWYDWAQTERAATRSNAAPDARALSLGFRVARTAP